MNEFGKRSTTLPCFLKLGAKFREDFVVAPGGRSVGFLMMIWLENQVAGREQDLFYFGILTDLFPGCRHDEPVMFAGFGGAVFNLFALERDPGDAHAPHVFTAEIASAFGVECGHLADLFASE